MSIEWCRLWHDMPSDPKFRSVAKRASRPTCEVLALFTAMLTNASSNEDERGTLRNWSHEDMGVALDIEPEHAEAIFNAMQGKLLDGNRLTGWERRQPKREDGSAERAKAWRERNRTQPNATELNQPTDSDPEKKEEYKPLPPEQDPAGEEVQAILKEVGLGKGGVVSLDARRKVAAKLNITSADPLVRLFEQWQGSHGARDVDALFIGSAAKIFRNAQPEVQAACQPIEANVDPPRPVPRASPELAAKLRMGARR